MVKWEEIGHLNVNGDEAGCVFPASDDTHEVEWLGEYVSLNVREDIEAQGGYIEQSIHNCGLHGDCYAVFPRKTVFKMRRGTVIFKKNF